MSVHLVLYSNNEPYDTTKRRTIESAHNYTNRNLIIHDYNLEKIKQLDWFKHIMNVPHQHDMTGGGRRDGYYNIWKAFITKDVYDMMSDGDILYYVDSSKYFMRGFTENIDKLCDIVSKKLRVAGSIGLNVRNNSYNCCDKIMVWNKIIPDKDNTEHVNRPHVLDSWFLFKKCKENDDFINDWVKYSYYTDAEAIYPLATYHHTADQSIFNILVIKYDFPVFFVSNILHDHNKDKNIVLRVINNVNADDVEKCFVRVRDVSR
jgi:hypothetical protein